MAKLAKKKQDELIRQEIENLNDILKDLPEDRKRIAQRLIERIAFMTVTLQILEDTVKTKGPTYLFKQGAQQMLIENPAQKSFNTMMNRYTVAYAKLFDLLPKMNMMEDDDDGLDDFAAERNEQQ